MSKNDFFHPTNNHHIDPRTERVFFESTDMPMLEMVRLLIVIFGGVDRFLDALITLKDTVKNVGVPAKLRDEVIEAFIMPINFVENSEEPKRFFFRSFRSDRREPGNRQNHPALDNLDWPIWKLMGYSIRIALIYTAGNKYDGSQSYFKNLHFDIQVKPEHPGIGMNAICDWLTRIVEYVKTSQLSHRLGIVSA